MKKKLLTLMTAALLILPLGTVALANHQETSLPEDPPFAAGAVPAQTGVTESMAPVLHAVVLGMLNHDAAALDLSDPVTAWECLYNMLSLYGQLDSRSEYRGEDLIFPTETVLDYAAALGLDLAGLSPLPEELSDRMTYLSREDSYLVSCGSDGLAEPRIRAAQQEDGALYLTGSLVYLVDGEDLARFQAAILPQDNMFGYVITAVELV